MNKISQRNFGMLMVLTVFFSGPSLAIAKKPIPPAKEAAAISVVARSKSDSGDYAMCADLYHQAYALDPGFIGYLYSAARCEQKAELLDRAEKHYRVFLQRSPEDTSLAKRAKKHLIALMELRKQTPMQSSPPLSKNSSLAAPSPEPGGVNSTSFRGWSLLSGGVLASVGGGYLLKLGGDKKNQLKDQLSNRSQGYIVGITLANAQEDERAYRLNYVAGGLLIGAGVAAVVSGVWWLKGAPYELSVAPSRGGGGMVQGTFSW